MAKRKRTPSGSVTAEARRLYSNKQGRFPIFDRKSARSALRLRGRAKTKQERLNVINRAAKYLPAMIYHADTFAEPVLLLLLALLLPSLAFSSSL